VLYERILEGGTGARASKDASLRKEALARVFGSELPRDGPVLDGRGKTSPNGPLAVEERFRAVAEDLGTGGSDEDESSEE
jgi:hypothetical protein